MLSDKSIEEFQRLYKQRFGKDISKQEALEKGLALINLVKAVLRPTEKKASNPDQKS